MTVTAVGFDLDYTLAVPERDRATLLAAATDAVGAPSLSREAYLRAHRDHLTEHTRAPIFAELLAGRDADVRPTDLAAAYRAAIADALVPVPGVESMLDTLGERYRVGLLTNGPTVAQRDKIETLGWSDRFDAVCIAGELPAGKPDPAAFDALLDALGTAAETTVFVGDEIEADIAGAAEAGLRVVQVTFPGGPDPDPRADAHLPREQLATRLPALLSSMDTAADRSLSRSSTGDMS